MASSKFKKMSIDECEAWLEEKVEEWHNSDSNKSLIEYLSVDKKKYEQWMRGDINGRQLLYK